MSTEINTVDDVISHLLQNKGKAPHTKIPLLPQEVIEKICRSATDILAKEKSLLRLSAPLNICGDVHGQFPDLLRIFEFTGYPDSSRYLFLGDYVDRGRQSIETMVLLLAYKIKYTDRVFLLRGNHEDAGLNRIYGFYDECKRKYNVKTWKLFVETFSWLPISALVENKILTMHGGLSPDLDNVNQIEAIQRPLVIPETGIVCDLLWSDPEEGISGWQPNDRGVSYVFGADVVKSFLRKNNLDLICRAHQVCESGYMFLSGSNRGCLTVFSAPNYDGSFENAAGIVVVHTDLKISIKILQNRPKRIKS